MQFDLFVYWNQCTKYFHPSINLILEYILMSPNSDWFDHMLNNSLAALHYIINYHFVNNNLNINTKKIFFSMQIINGVVSRTLSFPDLFKFLIAFPKAKIQRQRMLIEWNTIKFWYHNQNSQLHPQIAQLCMINISNPSLFLHRSSVFVLWYWHFIKVNFLFSLAFETVFISNLYLGGCLHCINVIVIIAIVI